MIVHVVLLAPRQDFAESDRRALIAALEHACANIPSIRRARVGRRRRLGYEYDALSPVSFDYAAIFEFDAESDLRAYLAHPSHAELGRLFHQVAAAAIVHDFEVAEGQASIARLLEG